MYDNNVDMPCLTIVEIFPVNKCIENIRTDTCTPVIIHYMSGPNYMLAWMDN